MKTPVPFCSPRLFLEAMRQETARNSLNGFVRYTMPKYQMGRVHEHICAKLDSFLTAVQQGESPRLMLCMPPRHGKSELATRRFPAYAFGRNPALNIIGVSYGAGLANRMNRDVQRIMKSSVYRALFPHAALEELGKGKAHGHAKKGKISQEIQDVSALRNTEFFEIPGSGGSYRSAGIGGGITGMGGDILIIDDPIKDRAEAESPVIRQNVWDWYTSTLYTRLSPGGGILLIQTRWHEDDLAGRLSSAKGGDAWYCLNFPAIAENEEPFRQAGEALHPERYPLPRLLAIKAALGPRDWAALYQQNPMPEGGALFKREWLRYWRPETLPQRFERMLISWDMAFKGSEKSDFVVGQVWGKCGANCYLLDQIRGRMGFSSTLNAFAALAEKWPLATEKLVEDKANGPAVIDSLKSAVPGIIPVEPQGGKIARANAVTPYFEAGNIFIPHPDYFGWSADYEAELLQFPASTHDDQVDATTQALRRLFSRPGINFNPANLATRRTL